MEAMWTKFQSLACAFKGALEDGRLGPPVSPGAKTLTFKVRVIV